MAYEITIAIDGVEVTTQPGRMVLEAAIDAGIYIPYLRLSCGVSVRTCRPGRCAATDSWDSIRCPRRCVTLDRSSRVIFWNTGAPPEGAKRRISPRS